MVEVDAAPPVVGPTLTPKLEARHEGPRLVRHTIELDDGHQVGLAICGRGVPLVVVNGFTAEGFLYAQTLSRLVSMGFKVVAIDAAGHGTTMGLPTGGATLEAYTKLLSRVLDDLGIRRAVLAGHSMGGRLVTELAATEPERAIAVLLVDAIVGDTWDKMVHAFRLAPPLMSAVGAVLALDTLTTIPLFRDPRQALKLGRLVVPTLAGHARRPWRMIGPMVSILRSGSTREMLDRLAELDIPVVAVHGDRDLAVPVRTGRDAARRSGGQLVVVHGGTHSWILKDPQTLPAVMAVLRKGRFGDAIDRELIDAGLDPRHTTLDAIEDAMYDSDARVLELTPPWREYDMSRDHASPRYRWTVEA